MINHASLIPIRAGVVRLLLLAVSDSLSSLTIHTAPLITPKHPPPPPATSSNSQRRQSTQCSEDTTRAAPLRPIIMDSLVPFQDLNAYPDPPPSSFSSALLRPIKIEPKLEPLDETTAPNLQPQPLLPSSPTTPFPDNPSDHHPNPTTTNGGGGDEDDDHVYSEFYRISEMFRSAFAKRMRKYGDGDVLDPNSGAIVPVPDESQQRQVVSVTRRSLSKRSSELVRVTNLSVEDHRYFRDVVRRTRMVYDSLRVYCMVEEERRARGVGNGRRARGDLRAAALMRDRGLWLNRDKRIVGSIPGVYIGDLFFFRMELCVVGLHGQAQAGIDYVPSSQSSNGEPIATSVIVSGGYEDDEDSGEEIVYTGHGGQDKFNRQCCHQKLEGGNLALERSMHYGIEIRVIRGFRYEGTVTTKVYVYDGLYRIVGSWFDVGKSGFGVYKYRLHRIEGQPEMGSTIMKFASTLRIRPLEARPLGYLNLDISDKKERSPVFLFNDIDTDHEPLYYEYLARTVFPPFIYQAAGGNIGCDCVSGCSSDGCVCAQKNGGKIPYDNSGFLVRGKPLIFECGPRCGCPPDCRNRVTQRGLRYKMEVFRSRETGWGVRTLDLIHAGAFICEYAGVVLTKEQAQICSMSGDSLIYPGRFTDRWAEWGDLSQIYPEYERPTYPSIPPLDFAMDVSRLRNVACYISHSTSPNVMVQFVLFDHNNMMFPHLMVFALENIPPMRELSLDYGVADEYTGKLSICN
ncbi:Histone-lysine N-methyltransferase family member SUVH9-like protein [Drosera capensis]